MKACKNVQRIARARETPFDTRATQSRTDKYGDFKLRYVDDIKMNTPSSEAKQEQIMKLNNNFQSSKPPVTL